MDKCRHVESFNGRLRDECLNAELFSDLLDAGTKLDAWRGGKTRFVQCD